MTYLLDTNIVSEFTRRRADARVVAWLLEVDEDATFLSVLTVGELAKGVVSAPTAERRQELEQWLRSVLLARYDGRIFDVSQSIAEAWGYLSGRARIIGKTVSIIDGLIAATALVHSCTIVTRNTRDFAPLGVDILNPFEPA